MQDATEVLNEINKVVNWYKKQKSSYNDIDSLLYTRKHLSCWSFSLAEIVGEAYTLFKEYEYERKSSFEKERLRIKKTQSTSVADAEMQAAASSADMRKAENESEAIFKRLSLTLNATNEILQTLNQHIAHLRSEKQAEMKGQGSQGT